MKPISHLLSQMIKFLPFRKLLRSLKVLIAILHRFTALVFMNGLCCIILRPSQGHRKATKTCPCEFHLMKSCLFFSREFCNVLTSMQQDSLHQNLSVGTHFLQCLLEVFNILWTSPAACMCIWTCSSKLLKLAHCDLIQYLCRWAVKLVPLIDSSLVADCLELAILAREIDMRASPYDLKSFFGESDKYEPIKIETVEVSN